MTEDLLELLQFGKKKPRKSSSERPLASLHEFYLTGEIEEAEDYIEWFDEIRHASELDVIKIYINSEGGNLAATIQLLSAMQESKAHIICSVEGDCCSAATLVFLAGDSHEIAPHSTFMFHNYSSGVVGKGGEMLDQISYLKSWSHRLLSEHYEDFLTKPEIQLILNNKDIWMDGEEVARRLTERNRIRENRSKKKPSKNSD